MKTAEPLIITNVTIALIKQLAAAASKSAEDEKALFFALTALPPDERAEIHALFTLGRAGHRSFNVALAAAKNQNLEHVPGMLADNRNFGTCLAKGLKRYGRQS